jgi:hypothetical protein
MLEKDIENLLAKYPTEFLPKRTLITKGQQVKLGSYYADILFQDNQGKLIIVEIKKGLLRREALGQAIEYYGLLRKKEPSKEINLMLVANTIPEGMTAFLNEKLGVEFLQLPQSKINMVAEKFGYKFLDSEQPRVIQEYKQTISKMDFNADIAKSGIWIFQANPQRYDVLNALADENLTDDMWLVSRYQNYIHTGDTALIWMSGKEGGIFAIVEITSNPQMLYDSEQSTKYWQNESDQRQMMLRVRIHYKLKLINNPILREELRSNPALEKMEIFRRPIGTNFKVTKDEWQAILGLLKDRFNFNT